MSGPGQDRAYTGFEMRALLALGSVRLICRALHEQQAIGLRQFLIPYMLVSEGNSCNTIEQWESCSEIRAEVERD
jgi:hypothetical protein